jgi:hypothetical protein
MNCDQLLAMRDLILIWWPNRSQVTEPSHESKAGQERKTHNGLTYMCRVVASMQLSRRQYSTLFEARNLRNAVYSTCIVSLSQQLCGGKSSDKSNRDTY